MGPGAVLIDIDGVLTVSWKPLPGAVEALARLEAAGTKTLLVTNTTSRTRGCIAAHLAQAGFDVDPELILTAPSATARYLTRHHPGSRCLLLNSGDITEDLAGVALVETEPDVVVLGGAGPEFSYEALDDAFRAIHGGAPLVAMHRNRYWRTDRGLQLDSGAFVAALEHAAGVDAIVVGKPAAEFFATALDAVGASASEAVMVGDDIESDVLGAQSCGLTGVLVRTGKYDQDAVAAAPGEPDQVIDSFADLPDRLGLT